MGVFSFKGLLSRALLLSGWDEQHGPRLDCRETQKPRPHADRPNGPLPVTGAPGVPGTAWMRTHHAGAPVPFTSTLAKTKGPPGEQNPLLV